ncbi:hypothetical protein [Gordonia sp. (in: high G+C Gram-positive bacteria)]|uniref:DUF7233 domain-containing protein n=1 Tax=Gordonia sp. (in: high G+C Gram-positive bacteria) TaxID=84139 RepID=UPI003C73F217
MQATIQLTAPGTLIVPVGSQTIGSTDTYGGISISVEFEYDYSQFDDPDSPAFEHQADIIRVDTNRTITIDRNRTCISEPGRHSHEKET